MYIFAQGATDATIYVYIRQDSGAANPGEPKTGLTYTSPGEACWYVRPLAAEQEIVLATQTVTGAHTDGGFVEVDATNNPGLYRLDLPDGALADGENYVIVQIQFTDCVCEPVLILLNPMPTMVTGKVVTDGSNTSSYFKTDLASSTTDFYKKAFVRFRTGANAGSGPKEVTAYSTSKFVTVSPAFPSTPSGDDEFVLIV